MAVGIVYQNTLAFKMNVSEYEKLGIKAGDKITLEIKISNNDNRA